MPRILDYNGRDADRSVTVATIVGLKEEGRQLAQVTAATADEAAAAEEAGVEMVVHGHRGPGGAVECELIPAKVMSEINKRTGMATISLGSGPDADVIFLFTSDICGEGPRAPRHARSYADLSSLYDQIAQERRRALSAFREDVATGGVVGLARIDARPFDTCTRCPAGWFTGRQTGHGDSTPIGALPRH